MDTPRVLHPVLIGHAAFLTPRRRRNGLGRGAVTECFDSREDILAERATEAQRRDVQRMRDEAQARRPPPTARPCVALRAQGRRWICAQRTIPSCAQRTIPS